MDFFQKEEPRILAPQNSPVEVYTEWDPLEEVIVGVIDDIRVPEWDPGLDAVIPKKAKDFFKRNSGKRFPEELLSLAKKEVNQLADILSSEGVRVRRPEEVNHHNAILTPHFTTGGDFILQCHEIVFLLLVKKSLKFRWLGEAVILKHSLFGKY